MKLATPRQFLAHFDGAAAQTQPRCDHGAVLRGLFANSQGVMIGSGEVWFSAVCAARDCNAPPVMITALNPQPPASP